MMRATDIRHANVVHPVPDGFQIVFGDGRYLLTVRENPIHGFAGSLVESLVPDDRPAEPDEIAGIEFHGGSGGPIVVHDLDGTRR